VQLLSLVNKKIVHEIEEAFQLPIYRTRKTKQSTNTARRKTKQSTNNALQQRDMSINQKDPRRNGEGLFVRND